MKLTIGEIYNLVDGLNDIINKEFPISISFKIQRNSLKVNDEIKLINEMRNKIINKYKIETEDPTDEVKIKEEFIEDAQMELAELEIQEVEIDLQTISISELEKSDVDIKPATLIKLGKIIDGGGEVNED